VRHARQIVSFYTYYTLEGNAPNVYRDAHAAKNLDWWRRYTDNAKIVYWAASPHVAADRQMLIHSSARPDLSYATVGSYLRRWYAHQYRSVGFSFDQGTISGGPGQPIAAPAPQSGWYERPLGAVPSAQFMLNLHTPAPGPVRHWLQSPVTTRAPDAEPGGYVSGSSLADWFDVLVHCQRLSPAHPLPRAG
jgi:erythromycin esterase